MLYDTAAAKELYFTRKLAWIFTYHCRVFIVCLWSYDHGNESLAKKLDCENWFE